VRGLEADRKEVNGEVGKVIEWESGVRGDGKPADVWYVWYVK